MITYITIECDLMNGSRIDQRLSSHRFPSTRTPSSSDAEDHSRLHVVRKTFSGLLHCYLRLTFRGSDELYLFAAATVGRIHTQSFSPWNYSIECFTSCNCNISCTATMPPRWFHNRSIQPNGLHCCANPRGHCLNR